MKKHILILPLLGLLLIVLILFLGGDRLTGLFNGKGRAGGNETLVVYHAGSLSVPMKNLADAFRLENPGVVFKMEAAGSIHCIRKITELNQPCDVLAVADFSLVDELMMGRRRGCCAGRGRRLASANNRRARTPCRQDGSFRFP
ncbi:MAG: substrate-binding domain-containing protein [Bacteroidales bacterium]